MTTVDGQIRGIQNQLQALQEQVDRLERDLDESRRLNLRAAELLDIAYDILGGIRTATTAPVAADT